MRELEQQVGSKLFERDGRGLALTETGRLVYSYANEMFQLGSELQGILDGHSPGFALNIKVGIAMVVPKLLAYRVLEPVLKLPDIVRLICYEAPLVDLLAELAVHKLDVVLADSPISPGMNVRAYNHALGESGISFFAVPKQAAELRADFPKSLDGVLMLMPSTGSSLRRNLENWFERNDINPLVVAEFEDRALMKVFGESGAGVFTSPTTVERDVLDKYSVEVIGRTDDITESYFAISAERLIKHPAVFAITETARNVLFT